MRIHIYIFFDGAVSPQNPSCDKKRWAFSNLIVHEPVPDSSLELSLLVFCVLIFKRCQNSRRSLCVSWLLRLGPKVPKNDAKQRLRDEVGKNAEYLGYGEQAVDSVGFREAHYQDNGTVVDNNNNKVQPKGTSMG